MRSRQTVVVGRHAQRQGSNRSGQRGWKAQPVGSAPSTRDRALDRLQPSAGVRPGIEASSPRVYGMLRLPEHVAHRPVLDDAASVHDGDAVGRFCDDAQVVGDEQERQVDRPPSSPAADRGSAPGW